MISFSFTSTFLGGTQLERITVAGCTGVSGHYAFITKDSAFRINMNAAMYLTLPAQTYNQRVVHGGAFEYSF